MNTQYGLARSIQDLFVSVCWLQTLSGTYRQSKVYPMHESTFSRSKLLNLALTWYVGMGPSYIWPDWEKPLGGTSNSLPLEFQPDTSTS